MKYLLMTSPNSQGKSEVFYSVYMPLNLAPSDLITRWDLLVENSPITVVNSTNEKNSLDSKSFSFLINGGVSSIFTINGEEDGDEKFEIAFSDPVIVKSVEDDSLIDIGYIWDGSDFTPPEN